MTRPAITPSTLGIERATALYLMKHGRISVADAARYLKCHRQTVHRLCKQFDINPKSARRAYLNKLIYRAKLGQPR